MTKTKTIKLLIVAAAIISAALFGQFSSNAKAFDFTGWKPGASGYEAALEKAVDQESPLIIYFSTEWCGWCKRLNQMYLESSDVQEALEDILKVAIDPDRGSAERKLQMKYGIRGFPAFLVTVPALEGRPVRVHPFRSNGALPTADFINAINITIQRQYGNKAVSLAEKQQYDDALRYFAKAREYYRDDSNLQYNIGVTYLAMAQKDQDAKYLDKAEESFLAALKIEAEHERAKSDLQKIEQLRSQWGKS